MRKRAHYTLIRLAGLPVASAQDIRQRLLDDRRPVPPAVPAVVRGEDVVDAQGREVIVKPPRRAEELRVLARPGREEDPLVERGGAAAGDLVDVVRVEERLIAAVAEDALQVHEETHPRGADEP